MAYDHWLLHATSRQILSVCGFGAHFRSTEIPGKTGNRWLIGLLVSVAAYALAGFLLAPRAIKLWIESPEVTGPGCRLRVQEVYVNPFTMFLSLRNVTLFEQENKLYVSTRSAETTVWTVEMLRAGWPGRDIAIRSLVVTGGESGETILTVPQAFIRSATVGADVAFIDADYARLERPDAAVTLDAAGMRHRPSWLSVPGSDRARTCISLDGFRADGGRLRITDEAVAPSIQLELRDVVAAARRKPLRSTASTEFDVDARIGAAGSISMKAQLRQPTGRHPEMFSMTARNIELQPLSPYFRQKFGRDIVAGTGDATLHHERNDAAIRLDNQLTVAGLRLADPHAKILDDPLPLEIALALATDDADRSSFTIQDSVSNSEAATVFSVFASSVTAHLDRLAASPFEVLAAIAGDADAILDEIAFQPGSAETAPAATDMLTLLARSLELRPRLGVRVRPAYDPAADRDAIAAQQVRLHIALATSAGRRDRDDPTEPNFNDPRVRDVLDEFAGARLSNAQRRAIARDVGDETTLYRDIFRALVANERVSETVLRRLARFRARSVIDALEKKGIDRKRFRIADALDIVTTDAETVSLRFDIEVRLPSQGG